ncbi:MAG: hypothetical protein IT430_08120 [Phycisphaerales bacterium]|nr:hypothetical protein [Phycisphaerales bacterium]
MSERFSWRRMFHLASRKWREPPDRPFKFGAVLQSGADVRHRHENVWLRQPTRGPDRLVIGPSGDHVRLMKQLMEAMEAPFVLLYVLAVPRTSEHAAGRYESPWMHERGEVSQLLDEFREYFENDGRHQVWIIGDGNKSQLVYDQHDLIYAYGPLNDFATALRTAGFREGEPRVPVPHSHHYNHEYDGEESRLIETREWKWFPLKEQDER